MASVPSISAAESRDMDPTQDHPRPKMLNGAKFLIAGFFVLALFVPLIGTVLHWDPVESSENRILARLPGMPRNFKDVSHFSELGLNYYRDHFGFRNTLIRGLSIAKYRGGLTLDQNTGIIIGKAGWLFFPSNAPSVLADRNLDPFTPAEVPAGVHLLEQRNRFCEEHHIAFIAIIPPDKQTVYPEFLP